MTKYLLTSLALVALLLSACSQAPEGSNLSPEEFSEKLGQMPKAPVVDVRTPEEFAQGHLPMAENIDWNGRGFELQVGQYEKDSPVFVYCQSGSRSAAAAAKMRKMGFTEVYELQGGIVKWRSAGLPEEAGNMPEAPGMSIEAFNRLLDSDKPVLIDFYADWCIPCKKMEPFVNELKAELAGKTEIIRINTEENRTLAEMLRIEALPTLQLYKDHTIVWEHTGYIDEEELRKQLQ